MTRPRPPEEQELLAGYVLYDLSPDEARLVEQWMAEDPAIAREIEQLQQAIEVAYGATPIEPPAALRASALQAYGTSAASPSPHPRRSPRRRWQAGLGAVAALLIAGLGISNYVLWRSLQQATC